KNGLQITEDSSFNCSVLFIDKGINPLVAFIRKSILFEYNGVMRFRMGEIPASTEVVLFANEALWALQTNTIAVKFRAFTLNCYIKTNMV
ncbi:MAG: hypothetical protein LBV41_04195, partial [Cytophagaceae bacterium]|nr:hypothetical protein [Cytophagaceae bacterium]